MNYDYLIVGAGLLGSAFAYVAKKRGCRCLLIDRRPHTGGNLHCERMEGITLHSYGPHIFHTSNQDVWNFVNDIVPFNSFVNTPKANFHGKIYSLPFNMHTFNEMWGVKTSDEARAIIKRQQEEALLLLNGREPQNLEEQAMVLVGRDIFETLIKEYTEKQWGRSCKELPAFIIKRLPIRYTFDNNYFNDSFQGIPQGGYNPLIDGMLEGTDVILNLDFNQIRHCLERKADGGWLSRGSEGKFPEASFRKIVYTGPLDEYFSYRFGRLEWRTLEFKHRLLPIVNFQGNAVVNYTSHEKPFTRIIEHKHFELSTKDLSRVQNTVITEEYSMEYVLGKEPYYPINDLKNNQLANSYRMLSLSERDVIFAGRLSEYRYYDMAPIIEKVLSLDI
ncbi:MAG: UDP-galactopyranose mutase [Alistipes sp.]|nr:UDP-galactopyranose mutase [Candidatus Alistipes equi]